MARRRLHFFERILIQIKGKRSVPYTKEVLDTLTTTLHGQALLRHKKRFRWLENRFESVPYEYGFKGFQNSV